MQEKLATVECFLFDMDGTVYLGDDLLPGTLETLSLLDRQGKQYYFLTNNSSRDQAHYRKKLAKMGIDVPEERIIISTHSAISYLSGKKAHKLFVLGTPELKHLLSAADFAVVSDGAADYVVVGFDITLSYDSLAMACQYIDAGVPYMATHPDVRCPLEGGKYLPDCGSMVALIETATGVKCEMVTGKPSRYMIDVVLATTGFKTEQLAVVGDRLYTDIALGADNGILSILLLTGEARRDDLKDSSVQPDIIFESIGDIARVLSEK